MDPTSTKIPQHVYQWIDGVEYLEPYGPEGYHPTHIGDEYSQGRYRIVHKLGFGSYSTVWLARDQREKRYVALKIIIAEFSPSTDESNILRHLSQGDPEHPGRGYVQNLLDEFFIDGPNGKHRCLVSEVAGCSIGASTEAAVKSMFPASIARAIAARVSMGLAYLHSCGVTHGDLHPYNILFQIANFDSLTLDEVYQKFGEPMKIPNRRCDGGPLGPEVPSYSVFTAIMLVRADQIKDSRILIADFGEAFRTNPPDALHTPVLLLPPEDFFHDKFGPPVDIWTFACTLYEIVGNRTLFECFFGSHEKVVADMISTLGMLPMRWLDQWRKHPYYEINRLEASDTIPLAQRLRNMGRGNTPEQLEQFEFSSEEVESLEKLLKAMLRYESSERITADEVMRSEYMVKWARPAIDSI